MSDSTRSTRSTRLRGSVPWPVHVLIVVLAAVLVGLLCANALRGSTLHGNAATGADFGVALLCLFGAILAHLWVRRINDRIKERKTTPQQRSIPVRKASNDERGARTQYIPDKLIDRIRFSLMPTDAAGRTTDTVIEYSTRLKWVYAFVRMAPMLLAAVLWSYLLWWLSGKDMVWRPHTLLHGRLAINFWPLNQTLLVILLVGSLIAALGGYFDWKYQVVYLTNARIHLIWAPPVWLPWLKNNSYPMDLNQIADVQKVEPWIGRILAYANVIGATRLQKEEDGWLKFHYMPHATLFRDVFDQLRKANQRSM